MNDLWPDFSPEALEENQAIEILREQARILEKKTNRKVKATFSKIEYSNSFNNLKEIAQQMQRNLDEGKELLEEELDGKKDAKEFYKTTEYKFEIYNETYRFRVFVLYNRTIFPIEIEIDEDIRANINEYSRRLLIDNNAQLKENLSSIFSSKKVMTVIVEMMRDKK